MATQSNASAKVPRVKVETAQNQQATPSATSQRAQAQEPTQPSAQKASAAPKPRVDVGMTRDAAKSAPKPKVAVVVPQKAASAGDPVPAQKAESAKKPAPRSKVTMAVEPQPEAEVPAPAQPTATPTQPVEAATQAGPSPATGTGGDSSAADASQDQVTNGQRIQEARRSILAWVHNTFPGHEHAFWGGVVALVIALMVFIIGPLRVLLIILLVLVGVAVGQVLDGDPKIIRIIAGLFDNDRDQS